MLRRYSNRRRANAITRGKGYRAKHKDYICSLAQLSYGFQVGSLSCALSNAQFPWSYMDWEYWTPFE